jgi:hypothetical protein
MRERTQGIRVSEKQIEILARRLLPEIRKFFADENVKKEFKEWQEKKLNKKMK